MQERTDFQSGYAASNMSSVGNMGGAGGILGRIDFGRLIRLILKRLWAVILVGVIVSASFVLYAKGTYVEQYTCSTTLAFTIETKSTVLDDNGEYLYTNITKKFYNSAEVDRYQYMLKGDQMVKSVHDALGEPYKSVSTGAIRSSFSVTSIEDITGFFVISVSSTNKDYCFDAINVVTEIFPDFLKTFESGLGVDVIMEPGAPTVSNSDNASRMATIGFALGAILVLAIIVLSDTLSDTVKGTNDLRNRTREKMLGSIPLIEMSQGALRKRRMSRETLLITDESSVSFNFVESFKAIRTRIENIAVEKSYKVFAVTSTFEDEGKTTVSTNLACALAQKGKSVLLIDCDLRKPAAMKAVGAKDDKQSGLISIIKGKSTYVDSIKFVKSLGIFVLPTGGVTTKSTELLDVKKVREVFDQARSEFDYVIVDTPPTKVVTDSIVLSSLLDALIFVVRNNYAKVGDVNETLEEIRNADIDIIGTILTMADDSSASKYYRRKGYRYRRYGRYGKSYKKYGYNKYGYGAYSSYGSSYGGYGNSYGGYGGYGGGYGGYGGYGGGYGKYGYGGKHKKNGSSGSHSDSHGKSNGSEKGGKK